MNIEKIYVICEYCSAVSLLTLIKCPICDGNLRLPEEIKLEQEFIELKIKKDIEENIEEDIPYWLEEGYIHQGSKPIPEHSNPIYSNIEEMLDLMCPSLLTSLMKRSYILKDILVGFVLLITPILISFVFVIELPPIPLEIQNMFSTLSNYIPIIILITSTFFFFQFLKFANN